MIVLGFIFFVFVIAVMQRLFPAIVAGLLLLLGLLTVYRCFCQLFHRVDQVLVRFVRVKVGLKSGFYEMNLFYGVKGVHAWNITARKS
ncbi:hypothetical protein AK95_09135 [Paenibacillus sp. LC231]|nr:hypothetical protein AK95_09135 [Paenibacillus sp. LC231]